MNAALALAFSVAHGRIPRSAQTSARHLIRSWGKRNVPLNQQRTETAMPIKKLKEFLDANQVKYVSVVHSQAYTAQEVAASAHVSGKAMAKTVILELDGQMA